jgi:hypothetical protein
MLFVWLNQHISHPMKSRLSRYPNRSDCALVDRFVSVTKAPLPLIFFRKIALLLGTVLAEKRKDGKNGKYLAFVTGSLGNLSADVYTFIELIAGVQITRDLQWRNTSRE